MLTSRLLYPWSSSPQASNREESRNVFVTLCTTFKRRCPPLNPCAGASFACTRRLAAIAGVGPARRCCRVAPPSAGLARIHGKSGKKQQNKQNHFTPLPWSPRAEPSGQCAFRTVWNVNGDSHRHVARAQPRRGLRSVFNSSIREAKFECSRFRQNHPHPRHGV